MNICRIFFLQTFLRVEKFKKEIAGTLKYLLFFFNFRSPDILPSFFIALLIGIITFIIHKKKQAFKLAYLFAGLFS